ncbi:hypothetical protein [Ekhidna sp.]|uniref:hypothetical protein n=1 Tax=Ekhidna sp. TaxID=2608089 RepID=UPI003511FCF2
MHIIKSIQIFLFILLVGCRTSDEVYDNGQGFYIQNESFLIGDSIVDFHWHFIRDTSSQITFELTRSILDTVKIQWIDEDNYYLVAANGIGRKKVHITEKSKHGFSYQLQLDSGYTYNGFMQKVDSFHCEYIDFNDSTNLKPFQFFDQLELSLPYWLTLTEKQKELSEPLGHIYIDSDDNLIKIQISQRERIELAAIKELTPELHTSLYNARFLYDTLFSINGIEFYVVDSQGNWNGNPIEEGIFRIYLNSRTNNYSLLIRYPVNFVRQSKRLKSRVLNSIRLTSNSASNSR